MLDAFHLPPRYGNNHVSIFTAAETTSGFAIWRKPRGAANMSAIIIGAGGGGGGGHSAAAGNARGGGGGGGSGAIVRFHVPLFLLPDQLYVQVGIGGEGGAATVDGSAGSLSYICAVPNISSGNGNIVQKSGGNTAAQGGAKGTGGAGGAGGAGETPTSFTTILAPWLALLNGVSVGGQAGVAGGAQTGAVGTSVTFAAGGLPVTGGAGGGGTPAANTNYAGGDITKPSGALEWIPTVAGGAAAGGAGDCYQSWRPFVSTGGSGGGTNGASGTGGAGGCGGPGSGGGGGGGGVTGGAGGRGGDGLVIIWAW